MTVEIIVIVVFPLYFQAAKHIKPAGIGNEFISAHPRNEDKNK